jgi:arabinogalactan oligomer/maltooligosaccharide transport system substrate-binding protein
LKKVILTLITAALTSGLGLAQTVQVWTHFGQADLQWLQEQAAAFEGAFGVDVEIVSVDFGEINQRMLLSAPQGEAADLIVTNPHDRLGELAVGGVIADMSQYVDPESIEDLSEAARLGFTFNGRLYGLPLYVEGPALVVNTDLVSELPETFEEFIETAQELTDGDTYGFMYNINDFYFSYMWIRGMGGYVFNRDEAGNLDPSDVGLNNEGAVRGMEVMRNLRHDYGLIPAGTDAQVASGQFTDGSLGMMYTGPWDIANFREAGINLQVIPVPPMEDGTQFAGFIGVHGIMMNEFSTNKDNAANFAAFLTRPDAQVSLAEITGKIPASQGAAEQVADDPVIAGFAAQYEHAEPMPNIPEMGSVWGPMAAALESINADANSDIQAILDDAVAAIQGN